MAAAAPAIMAIFIFSFLSILIYNCRALKIFM